MRGTRQRRLAEVCVLAEFASFDVQTMSRADSYKLLASTVLPRPIAWITSVNAEGVVNAAPFSFFNIVSSDPPLIAVSFSGPPDRPEKDTMANIQARHEFVVNMVPEELAEAMNMTATNAPRGTSEVELAGLELAACDVVKTPRLAGSPVAMECRLHQMMSFGGTSTLMLAHVLQLHVREDAFANRERLYIDPGKLRLVGRMHSPNGYATTRDVFQLERKSWPLK